MDEIATPALILDKVEYGERDIILTLLTQDCGLTSVIAKSAQVSKKRFSGILDLFVLFRAHLRRRKAALSLLVAADPIKHFAGVFDNLARLEVGQAMLAVTRDLLRIAPSTPHTFQALLSQMEQLENCTEEKTHVCLVSLCLALLDEVGHVPSDARCPVCNGFMHSGISIIEGGIMVCARCSRGNEIVSTKTLQGFEDLSREEAFRLVSSVLSAALSRPYHLPRLFSESRDRKGCEQ